MKISLFDRIFGVKCPQCHKRSRMEFWYSHYSRGENHLCRQAIGCDGFYCRECATVIYTMSFEDYQAVLPDWCTPKPDSPRSRFFPEFKYNRRPRTLVKAEQEKARLQN